MRSPLGLEVSWFRGRRKRRRGGGRGGGSGVDLRTGLFRFGGFDGTDDVDAAFEEGAILDDNTDGFDVADELGVFADLDAFGGFDVAVDGAEDDDFLGTDAGLEFAVGSDGEAVFEDFDRAIDFAVDIKVFATEQLPLDDDAFADGGGARAFHFDGALGEGVHWDSFARQRRRGGRIETRLGQLFLFTAIPHVWFLFLLGG